MAEKINELEGKAIEINQRIVKRKKDWKNKKGCSDLWDNKTGLIGLNGVPGVRRKKGQKVMA